MELQSQPQPPKKRSYIAQSSGSTEYAQKVGEGQQFRGPPAAVAPTRLGVRGGGGGEIVEVQGGHIVRSTGRKDRHSKVCTAKGPRDRRVRLSAHTAIQFYDVQDRLGYDRPSKAVDWLIKKAKAAIDELAELPAWKPTTSAVTVAATSQPLPGEEMDDDNDNQNQSPTQTQGPMDAVPLVGVAVGGAIHSIPLANAQIGQNRDNNSNFLPPSLDSDSIADTIKSFFPLGASAGTTGQPPSAVQLHSYPHPPDLLSRTSSHQSQDLRLSLHSFTDPILVQHRHQQQPSVISFSGTQQLGFETAAPTSPVWSSDHQHHQQQQHSHTTFPDISRFQRIPSWNISAATGTGDGGDSGNRGTFLFAPSSTAPPPQQPILQPLFAQNQGQYFSQRGPLQSSNTPPIRAWINPTTISTDHQHHHQQIPQQQQSININPHAISELGFSPGGFLGYHIPARIRGQEEEDRDEGAILSKPSSASSESRH